MSNIEIFSIDSVGKKDSLKNVYSDLEGFLENYKYKKDTLKKSKNVNLNGFVIEGDKGDYRENVMNYSLSLLGDIEFIKFDLSLMKNTSELEEFKCTCQEENINNVLVKDLDSIDDRSAWLEKLYKICIYLVNEEDKNIFISCENIENSKYSNFRELRLDVFSIPSISLEEKDHLIKSKINEEDFSDDSDFEKLYSLIDGLSRKKISLFVDLLLCNSLDDSGFNINRNTINDTFFSISDFSNSDINVVKPDKTYNDVGGLDKEINRIKQILEWPLSDNDLFKELGSETPKGILLYGSPGTGKTLLAKAVAGSADYNMIDVKCSNIMQKYLGKSEEKVKEVFRLARNNKPCIIFLDEFDAIGRKRDSASMTSTTATSQRVVSELLSELDGMNTEEGVKIIASSNRPGKIDPALLRSGRISEKIRISKPNSIEDIISIINIHMKDKPSKDIDFKSLGEKMIGLTGGDIERICNESSLIRIRKIKEERATKEISKEDIIEAISKVKEEKSNKSDDEDLTYQ